jgi:hypothetical protein
MPIDYNNEKYSTRIAELCVKLGSDLKAARKDDSRVAKLFTAAVAQFMLIAREEGASATEQAGELGCAEILRDGSGEKIPSPFEIAGATDDEFSKWSDLLADAADY